MLAICGQKNRPARGTDVVERYFSTSAGYKGIRAARAQYDAWRALVETATWKTPEDVKKAHPKASILKGGRVRLAPPPRFAQ